MKKLICFLAVLVFCALAGFAGLANPQDTCYANGDANGDGLIWTIADLVLVIKMRTCDAPVPESLYRLDLTADCRVDSFDLRIIEGYYIYGSSILPRPFPVPTCCNPTLILIYPAAKGDVNADGGLTPADVVLMLTCASTETGNVFIGTASCSLCQADLNCDFDLSPVDLVQELNYVFLGAPPSGCP